VQDPVAHARRDARFKRLPIEGDDCCYSAHDARIIGCRFCDRQLARLARMMVA
jgi:hypothetical protein